MAMVRDYTTTTNWQGIWIDIEETRKQEYWSLHLTPEFETKLQQGITEGWIVVLGEE